MQLPEYVKPEGYPEDFFTDIQSSTDISIMYDQLTGQRVGKVNGHTYTDRNGNVRHKYEVVQALSASAILAEYHRRAAAGEFDPDPEPEVPKL